MGINKQALPRKPFPVPVDRSPTSSDAAPSKQPPSRRSYRMAHANAVPASSLNAAMRALLEADGSGVSDTQLKVLLARLTDAMLEGVVVCGGHGEITYVNDNLCHMLGRTREELTGKPAAKYFGQMYARSREAVAPADNAFPCDRYEVELRTQAGRNIVVEVSTQRIDGASGKHLGCFTVMMDITARTTALRQSESEVRLLSAQFMAAQELERQRIARELHDGIGQALGGIKFGLEACDGMVTSGSSQAAVAAIRQMATKIQSVMEEVRRISMNLRPSTLDDLGILPTLGWFTREFRSIYDQLDLKTDVDVCEGEIAAPVKTAIYRIVQEAFNNVVTHSRARKVSLVLKREGSHIRLQIDDDGQGFDPAGFTVTDDSGRGLGLASMRERAEVTGGRFRLESIIGHGTTVAVTWASYCPRLEGRAED